MEESGVGEDDVGELEFDESAGEEEVADDTDDDDVHIMADVEEGGEGPCNASVDLFKILLFSLEFGVVVVVSLSF